MGCRRFQKYFILEHYQELGVGQRRRLEKHLSSCRRCTEEFSIWNKLWQGLDASIPEADSIGWDMAWNAIEKGLAQPPAKAMPFRKRIFPYWPRLTWGLSLAAVFFAAGIWIGRLLESPRSKTVMQAAREDSSPSAISEAVVLRYLGELRPLLVDWANAGAGSSRIDIPGIDDLLLQHRLLRSACRRSGRLDLLDLFDDLELVLLEARRSAEAGRNGQGLLRRLVREKELPLRLNLYVMQNRNIRI